MLGSILTSPLCLPPHPCGPPLADSVEMVSEVEPPAHCAGAGPSSKQPVAEGLLTALEPYLSEALVSQVGACYQFNVDLPNGTQSTHFLDLTTGAAALSALSFLPSLLVAPPPPSFLDCPCQYFRVNP